jgi:hypothetical protein
MENSSMEIISIKKSFEVISNVVKDDIFDPLKLGAEPRVLDWNYVYIRKDR